MCVYTSEPCSVPVYIRSAPRAPTIRSLLYRCGFVERTVTSSGGILYKRRALLRCTHHNSSTSRQMSLVLIHEICIKKQRLLRCMRRARSVYNAQARTRHILLFTHQIYALLTPGHIPAGCCVCTVGSELLSWQFSAP